MFFLQSKMTFLVYLIDRSDFVNIEAVTGFTIPKTLVHVHGFLGLVRYFRPFLVTFQLQLHLYIIYLKKNAQFKFYEEELKTFKLLKYKLVEMPIFALHSSKIEIIKKKKLTLNKNQAYNKKYFV